MDLGFLIKAWSKMAIKVIEYVHKIFPFNKINYFYVTLRNINIGSSGCVERNPITYLSPISHLFGWSSCLWPFRSILPTVSGIELYVGVGVVTLCGWDRHSVAAH